MSEAPNPAEPLTFKEWELLSAVSLGATGVESAPELAALLACGYVAHAADGCATTDAGNAYLREEVEATIRVGDLLWLSLSGGPESR